MYPHSQGLCIPDIIKIVCYKNIYGWNSILAEQTFSSDTSNKFML